MNVKRTTLAGTWYPAERARLANEIDQFLGRANPTRSEKPPLAVIVPHAGYRYCGFTAAYSYKLLAGEPVQRVILLAPSHRHLFRGAVLAPFAAFQTPLGEVAVDESSAELVDGELVRIEGGPFHGEHSLEIQLPFLQRVLAGARVVPLLLGHLSAADHARLAAVLRPLLDARTVVVVSSDFTHYGTAFDYLPFPPVDGPSVRTALERLDMAAIRFILAGDAQGFADHVVRTGATICGRVPITAFLSIDPGCRGELLHYSTSYDQTGDYEHSVSYAAIAFPRA